MPSDDDLFYIYYIIGDRPVRIGYIAEEVPVIAEVPDFDSKTFVIDNNFIHIAAKSMDVQKIDKEAFLDWCLKNGFGQNV